MKKINYIILGLILLGIITVIFLQFAPSADAPAENEEEVISDKVTLGGNTTTTEGETISPEIETNEYSVYLGFAEKLNPNEEMEATEVPYIVTGYEWEALLPGPGFGSITLPVWDTENKKTTYTVEGWEFEEYTTIGDFKANEKIDLPQETLGGFRRLKVTGIDPELKVCPTDRSFTWGSQFSFSGDFGLVRTPIIEPLPAGELCELR